MKIAISLPCLGSPKLGFTVSLANLTAHTAGAAFNVNGRDVKPEVRVFSASGSRLSHNRNLLFAEAANWGAIFQLWVDWDHIFPPDALIRLIRHGKAAVGANYPRRTTGELIPSATRRNRAGDLEAVATSREIAEATPLEAVETMGLGLCLVNMATVLPALRAKAEGGEIMPLFRSDTGPDGDVGEDSYFFGKLREAGIQAHVDHRLSLEVGHITETVLRF